MLEVTRNAHTDFYPRSPCGERQYLVRGQRPSWGISIHALLAESDIEFKLDFINQEEFLSTLSLRRATREAKANEDRYKFLSTLSLRRATPPIQAHRKKTVFLSTLSLRRATCYRLRYSAPNRHFYPRSPCGERPAFWFFVALKVRISIHALLAESDAVCAVARSPASRFLSTLSLRRATSLMLYDTSSLIFLSTLSLRRATALRQL